LSQVILRTKRVRERPGGLAATSTWAGGWAGKRASAFQPITSCSVLGVHVCRLPTGWPWLPDGGLLAYSAYSCCCLPACLLGCSSTICVWPLLLLLLLASWVFREGQTEGEKRKRENTAAARSLSLSLSLSPSLGSFVRSNGPKLACNALNNRKEGGAGGSGEEEIACGNLLFCKSGRLTFFISKL
jgi:hypothetical protein